MKGSKHWSPIFLNIVFLICGLVLGAVIYFEPVPHGTPDEFHAHIERVTADARLQKLFLAEEANTRSFEHLARVGWVNTIGALILLSGLALTNLVANLRENKRRASHE